MLKAKYVYVLPGLYLMFVVLFIIWYLKGVGHGPNPFSFVFYLNRPACLVLDLFPDLINTGTELPQVISCLLAGLIMYGILGWILDLGLKRRLR
jgi:hypothetical protein